jgi:hypothetical protein
VHKTTKNDAEDLFLQTVSFWTDNGAAANGAAPGWKTSAAPPQAKYGAYLQLNYSMVNEKELGAIVDSIDSSGGVRGAFFGRNLHSRMPLDPTQVRLKL